MKTQVENIFQEYYQKLQTSYPHHTNWCSQVGHPCERNLFYQRTKWQELKGLDVSIRPRLETGNAIESIEKKTMREAGIPVFESPESVIDSGLELSGKLDCEIEIEKKIIPVEIKSINDFYIDKYDTVDDLLKAKWYHKQYLAQIGLYIYIKNKELGLLIIRSFSKRKIMEITIFDNLLDYLDEIIAKINRVNSFVKEGKEPERIQDESICEMCNARHICMPDFTISDAEFSNDKELEDMLDRRESLKQTAKEYEEINDYIKGKVKAIPNLVVGKYQILGKYIDRKEYTSPAITYWSYKIKKL